MSLRRPPSVAGKCRATSAGGGGAWAGLGSGWGQPSAWSLTGSGIRGQRPAPRATLSHGGLSGGLFPAQLRECPPRPCCAPAHFFSTFSKYFLLFCFLQTCLSGTPQTPFLSSFRSRSASVARLWTAGVAARVTAGEGWGAAGCPRRHRSGNRDTEARSECGEPRRHRAYPITERPPGAWRVSLRGAGLFV